MTVSIPTLEEIDKVYRDAPSPDVGQNDVHGLLAQTFEKLSELLEFKQRVDPKNRDAVLDLFSKETRERIEAINSKWFQGVDLLLAMERIGDVEDYLLPDILTGDDIEKFLLKLFQKLRSTDISDEEAALILAEIFRRSPGLARTKSGHQYAYLVMLESMYPEIVKKAWAMLSPEEVQDLVEPTPE